MTGVAETVLIFGLGRMGEAFARTAPPNTHIIATARPPEKRDRLMSQGIDAIDPVDITAVTNATGRASSVLITCAPDSDGCPAFRVLFPALSQTRGKWIGYLSTTGVYGDRRGGWVFEDSTLEPLSAEARNRVMAEAQWQSLSAVHRVDTFRLPGLYGPGRSVIDRLKDATVRAIHKPDQVFSRLYEADGAEALWLAQKRQSLIGDVFNLCDDEPAPADQVMLWAARTFGFAPPAVIAFDDPALSPAMRRFYNENKRVSNARAKAVLRWRPAHPTYREGLNTIWRNQT